MKALALIALLAASPLYAGSSSVIYTEESQPGELMDDFVVRIAPRMANRTKITGYEFCGVIETNSERMRIEVYTSRSSTECRLHNVSTDAITVHTHPIHMALYFGEGDYQTSGYLIRGRTVLHQKGQGTERVVSSR